MNNSAIFERQTKLSPVQRECTIISDKDASCICMTAVIVFTEAVPLSEGAEELLEEPGACAALRGQSTTLRSKLVTFLGSRWKWRRVHMSCDVLPIGLTSSMNAQ